MHATPALVVFLPLLIAGFYFTSNEKTKDLYADFGDTEKHEASLCYEGSELNFSDELLTSILNRHFPYFTKLSQADQLKFITRLKDFIAEKTFKIYDSSGFREMPILISATAVQLTFGLNNYLLPRFKNIRIFPEEFVRASSSIDFLEGNVSGQSINLSWKHFIDGFRYPEDGQNVGLHEMAHALYYQNFISEDNEDTTFRNTFEEFNNYGNKTFNQEKDTVGGLYSSYAFRNTQEFWAESIEIFFERPIDMQARYPNVYKAISDILKQDPAALIASSITS